MNKKIKQGFNAAAAAIGLSILVACIASPDSGDNGMLSGDLRTLSCDEVDLAKTVFADTIDYSTVYIKTTDFPSGSKAYNGIMRFSEGDYSKDFSSASLGKRGTFIHELEHMRQEQTGTNLILSAAGLFLRGGYINGSAYKYDDVENIESFSDLNIEQKAALTEHFYEKREKYKGLWSDRAKTENCAFQNNAGTLLRGHLPDLQTSPECDPQQQAIA